MLNSKLTPLVNPVNATLDDAVHWAASMGERGVYAPNTARIRVTAVERLKTVLGADESREVKWFLENIDSIANRWANRNTANPNTVQSYRSRARAVLEDFLDYQENPASFKPKRRESISDNGTKKERNKKVVDISENVCDERSEPAPIAAASPSNEREVFRSFPLEGKDDFKYILPRQGISVREVLRTACHLLTYATDFDPTNPSQAQVFAIVRRES